MDTKTDTFPAQHDKALLEAKATAITGFSARAGETHLGWMATLTRVESGPVFFSMHGDGYIETMGVVCPSCGDIASDAPSSNASAHDIFVRLARISFHPKGNFVGRAWKRFFGCTTCVRYSMVDFD